jgi:hypothetical protein
MSHVYLGLVHYPVTNKSGEKIQTSVTNLDIHDIARTALSFGIINYFIITPDITQREYISKIISFWQSGNGESYNQDRSRALSTIKMSDSIQSGINQITMQEGMQPIVISTTARQMSKQISYSELQNLGLDNTPLLILFGTGYGLSDDVHADADYILQPIKGYGDYNHLSVRSAVAIILDRITSAVYKGRN